MIHNKKMLIVFKNDVLEEKQIGEKCYIKFLDDNKNYAIFYNPLIAPKYLKEYLKENDIYEAYIITSKNVLDNYEDKVYTLKPEAGVFKLEKGFTKEEKLVMLVDKAIDINLDLPRYSYEVSDNQIILKPYKNFKNNYCYVAKNDMVNPNLAKIMIPVFETIPNVLEFNTIKKEDKIKKFGIKK